VIDPYLSHHFGGFFYACANHGRLVINCAGFVIAGDGLIVNSGYTALFGGLGRYQAGTGNTLLVIKLEELP
jgi:hypothetical protein